MGRTRVIYILGAGRSGSTMLSMLLGNLDGIFNAGEVRYLFNRDLQVRDLPCSCGESVYNCVFWGDIIPKIDHSIVDNATAKLRASKVLSVFLQSDLAKQIGQVYANIASKANVQVLIDSSKHPVYAKCLSMAPNIELRVIHLVRDPRGMVSSWSQNKEYLGRKPAWKVALIWVLLNLLSEVLFANHPFYLRLRYEDFVENPRKHLLSVLSFCGLDSNVDEIVDGDARFYIKRFQHILAGNPEKLKPGNVIEIRKREWKLALRSRILTQLITYPIARHYGYLG